jgi:HK97 gp10 family phage protein
MNIVSFRVTGEVELMRNLERLAIGPPTASLQRAANAGAAPIRDRMEQKAPVGGGKPDIKDHIITQELPPSLALIATYDVAVAIGPSRDFFYGYYLEFGTVKMPAQPFARPAFDEGQQEAMSAISTAFWADVQLLLRAV